MEFATEIEGRESNRYLKRKGFRYAVLNDTINPADEKDVFNNDQR